MDKANQKNSFIRRVNKRQQEQLTAVFRRTMAMHLPEGSELPPGAHLNAWDWGPGIAHYGLLRAYPQLDPILKESYFTFWNEWFTRHLDKTEPSSTLNGALLLTVLWRAAHDPDFPLVAWEREAYRAYCNRRARFYLKNASRLSSGVFGHSVAGIAGSEQQVWSDNLFMLVLFLANWAVTNDDHKLFGQMMQQLEWHYQHLTDPATGLLYHGWQENANPQNLNGALWGRGNGWAAMAVVELLELCDTPGFDPFREIIRKTAQPQFQALLAFQRADGRWNTLVDKSWSYPETSVTAAVGFAFTKGVRLGWLGDEFAEAGKKALNSLEANISSEGEVGGASGSTPLLPALQAYEAVPTMPICTWGQGIGLLALAEGMKVEG